MVKKEAALVSRPLDVGTVNVDGVSIHVTGPNNSSLEHWAMRFPNGKIVGYYSDNTVHNMVRQEM